MNEEIKDKSVLLRHMEEKHGGQKVEFDMKVIKSFQHNPLARQCAEAVRIKNIEPQKRINNKEEYHQPGDVEVTYNKNINEKYKTKEKKKSIKKASEVCKQAEEKTSKSQKKVTVEANLNDFLREMRRKSEKKKQAELERNDEVEDELISTQMMVDDARARRELLTKETEARFKCQMCEFSSGSKNILTRHKKNHQSDKMNVESVLQEWVYPCNQCEYKANKKEELKTHRELVHVEVEYSCDQCEYKTTKKDELKTHIESIHKANKEKDQNIWTEKEVLDSTSQPETIGTRALPKKKTSKHVSKRINCDLCERKFNKKETHSKHMLEQHKKVGQLGGDAGKLNSKHIKTKEVPPILIY